MNWGQGVAGSNPVSPTGAVAVDLVLDYQVNGHFVILLWIFGDRCQAWA